MQFLQFPPVMRFDGESTWANRGTGSAVGALKRITDIGDAAGITVVWDGTNWVLPNPTVLYDNKTAQAGTASTSEQILKQASLPGSLIRNLKSFDIAFLVSKDGTTDAATTTRIRLGVLGTTGDTDSYSTSAFNAAGRMFSGGHEFFAFSNTVLRGRMTAQNLARNSANSTAAVYPVSATLSDFSAATFFVSVTVVMAGTTNIPSGNHLIITGY